MFIASGTWSLLGSGCYSGARGPGMQHALHRISDLPGCLRSMLERQRRSFARRANKSSFNDLTVYNRKLFTAMVRLAHRKLIYSSRRSIAGWTDSARWAGIHVATRPSNDITRTTLSITSGSRGVAA